ncbi:MAG: Transcriptional regulator, GntR family domain / Aspartate aminotransferase, partial [Cyanobacteria bacterium RYN_339]|nr:Transcriptional regulator, GntR family domain / Aspartate aminotransferase [Cyanobacteria bacterium RYN_339]
APAPAGMLHLAGTDADLRLVPVEALARAYRRVLLEEGPQVLNTGNPRGHARLRGALAEMLRATRAVAAEPDAMIVTRGSQMALYLAARALVRPGDVVAIEALGYRPAWEAFQAAGARLVPVPVDAQGLDVAALARVPDVRVVYLTPHHHYPTTVTLSPGRRLQLLELAAARGFTIVEDDYDNEFHYDGRPVLPLASADPGVVYVGTLSKILAPGLRLGFVSAPAELVTRMAEIRRGVDGQGDHAVECAVASLLADREVQRHAHRMRRAYMARRAALVSALQRHLPGALGCQPPAGGMALWALADAGIDLKAWVRRGLEAGVSFGRARPFAFEGPEPHAFRLGFAALAPEELEEAVKRMAACL